MDKVVVALYFALVLSGLIVGAVGVVMAPTPPAQSGIIFR